MPHLIQINDIRPPIIYPRRMQPITTTPNLRELGCHQRHGLAFQCLSVFSPGQSFTNINNFESLRLQI